MNWTKRVLGAIVAVGTLTVAAVAVVGAGTAAGPAAAQYKPVNSTPPTISDTTPTVGETLTATAGTWQTSGSTTYSFQWRRCNGGGNNCTDISGAGSQSYAVSSADNGNTLRVEVTASNADGKTTASSAATQQISAGSTPPPSGTIPIGSVNPPNRLIVDKVTFSPSPITSRSAPITIRVRVIDAQNHRPVSGALVFLRSTPQVTTTPPEQATGSDGTVTLTTTPERDFGIVFRPHYNLQFFVRTRGPGGDLLAGISGRRLVQVPLNP
jgi:hypothetical protein